MENYKEWRKKILDNTTKLISNEPDLRFGQAVLILLNVIDKDICNELVGTNVDCFYIDRKVDDFLNEFYKRLKNKNND